ncbi:hypothetical protein CB1_001437049 [Camelus ferus]|nr:hypothetical protein CB1_001437049 [Camelus ferus]
MSARLPFQKTVPQPHRPCFTLKCRRFLKSDGSSIWCRKGCQLPGRCFVFCNRSLEGGLSHLCAYEGLLPSRAATPGTQVPGKPGCFCRLKRLHAGPPRCGFQNACVAPGSVP